MELPVVNHEDYFAKIGDDHKFPINKFGELANYLIKKNVVKKFHKPYPCSSETLNFAHSEKYIRDIKNKTLDKDGVKKIVMEKNNLKLFFIKLISITISIIIIINVIFTKVR